MADALCKACPFPLIAVREGVVVFANRAAERSLGAAGSGDLSGRPLEDCLHMDDAERIDVLVREAACAPSGDDAGHVEHIRRVRVLRLDGTLVLGDARISWLDPDIDVDESPTLLFGWTERNEAEDLAHELQQTTQRLRDTQAAAGIGSWEWDLLSGDAWWSDALFGILGIEPGACAPSYGAFLDRVHEDDQALVRASFRRAFRGERPLHAEFRIKGDPDRPKRVLARARLVRDGANRPLRLVGTTLDVTETRALEELLQQSQKMEAIGALAGGVAHDFNNLLSVILGNAELAIARLPKDSDLHVDLEEIRRAAERAAELTGQLLAFGRRQALEARVLDVRDVVKDTCRMLRRILRENVSIDVRLGDESSLVRVDPVKIEQILLNLAINSQDAMPDGGRFVIETTRRRAAARPPGTVSESGTWPVDKNATAARDEILLRVSDTGVGMDARTQARIFDPFFTTKERGRGTGLGLSTVYGIVKQHRGRILVRSRPGEGTRFEIVLPAYEEELREPPPARIVVRPSTRDLTVLVVEDDAMVRRVLSTLLAGGGFRVLMADGPRQAVEIVKQRMRIDVLLTDVVLPDMTGRRLHETLLEMLPGLPVVYMSGYAEDVITSHGFLDEGIRFLQKPFGGDRLVNTVCEAVAERA